MTKSVEIELTTKCTLECPACPRTYRRKFGDRTWDTGHLDKNIVFKTFELFYFAKRIIRS